jgi:hypothetical protein
MNRITQRLVAAGVGAVSAIAMIAVPAGAASATPAQNFGAMGRAALAHMSTSTATDASFAGYADTPSQGVTSLSASFIVPRVSCPANSEINIAGAIYDTAGALQAGADVIVDCAGGVATYGISALTYNTDGPTVFVHPGDLIVVVDSETPSTTTATSIDLTAHTSSTAEDATGSSGEPSATFFIGLFDDTASLPTFSWLPMVGVQANHQWLSQLSPIQFNQGDGHQLMIATTPVFFSSFALIFLHNT